ncbi:MAG: hypothetical protein J5I47_06280 [Vicingus serpentipes]|nr:hypothetical protein [Vicingus serpentipes]
MKKILIIITFFAAITTVFSQNTTTGDALHPDQNGKHDVLIIPFESKMYLSDIDRDIAAKNEMSFDDIKAKFRAALDQNIFIACKPYFNPLSFYTIEPQEAQKELSYIYNSVGYKYEVMPEEEVVKKENVGTKLIGKFKKSKRSGDPASSAGTEEEYIEAGVQNGQVVSQVDNREKYMNTKISNDNLLLTLNKKYQPSYYIFVNELDIKRSADKRYVASSEQYQREIKVHYTIFDNGGKEVSSGAVKARFPSGQNDIDNIIKTHFPLIAQTIVGKIVGINVAEAK